MKMMLPAAAAAVFAMTLPATAQTAPSVSTGPAVGFGFSFAFGGPGAPEAGFGLRLFSDDASDSFVGSVGVDYMFKSKRFRPTLGLAYLGDDAYIGADIGLDLGDGGLDYGLGAGLLDTQGNGAGSDGGSGNDSISGSF